MRAFLLIIDLKILKLRKLKSLVCLLKGWMFNRSSPSLLEEEKEEILVETLQVNPLQPVDHVQYEQPT